MQEKKQEKQKMRFADRELELIKSIFADNDELIVAIRKVMWQVSISESESTLIQNAFKDNDEAKRVVRKMFMPELDPEAPIYQVVDLWMTVDIKDKDPETAVILYEARNILIKYLKERMALLFNESLDTEINFAELIDFKGKEDRIAYANIIARNTIITHVEQQLAQASMLAGSKTETVEETKTRLAKNSTK